MEILIVVGSCITLYVIWHSYSRRKSKLRAIAEIRDIQIDQIRFLIAGLKEGASYSDYETAPFQLKVHLDTLLDADPTNELGLNLKSQMEGIRKDCATEAAMLRAAGIMNKASLASSVATKQRQAREAIQILEGSVSAGVADAEKLSARIVEIENFTTQTEIDSFIEKGERFEFKGSIKKAIDCYQDALFSAKRREDKHFRETMADLTRRIEKLKAAS